jgi:hypothetical protein
MRIELLESRTLALSGVIQAGDADVLIEAFEALGPDRPTACTSSTLGSVPHTRHLLAAWSHRTPGLDSRVLQNPVNRGVGLFLRSVKGEGELADEHLARLAVEGPSLAECSRFLRRW